MWFCALLFFVWKQSLSSTYTLIYTSSYRATLVLDWSIGLESCFCLPGKYKSSIRSLLTGFGLYQLVGEISDFLVKCVCLGSLSAVFFFGGLFSCRNHIRVI